MRFWFAGVIWFCVIDAACSQPVVDGSDASIPAESLSQATLAIRTRSSNPTTVQIRKLKLREIDPMGGPVSCGEVNFAANPDADVDFLPFIYAPAKASLLLANPGSAPEVREFFSKVLKGLCAHPDS